MAAKKRNLGIDRWTSNGYGIVADNKNMTAAQKKAVDEMNAQNAGKGKGKTTAPKKGKTTSKAASKKK